MQYAIFVCICYALCILRAICWVIVGLYTTYQPLSPAFYASNGSLSILTYIYNLRAPFKPYRPSQARLGPSNYNIGIYSTHTNTNTLRESKAHSNSITVLCCLIVLDIFSQLFHWAFVSLGLSLINALIAKLVNCFYVHPFVNVTCNGFTMVCSGIWIMFYSKTRYVLNVSSVSTI